MTTRSRGNERVAGGILGAPIGAMRVPHGHRMKRFGRGMALSLGTGAGAVLGSLLRGGLVSVVGAGLGALIAALRRRRRPGTVADRSSWLACKVGSQKAPAERPLRDRPARRGFDRPGKRTGGGSPRR